MKTIEQEAKNYVKSLSVPELFGRLKQPRGAGIELLEAFKAGVKFAQRFTVVEDGYPEQMDMYLCKCYFPEIRGTGLRLLHWSDNKKDWEKKEVVAWRPIYLK